MHIHTVKTGDTVFKIARQYATSPMKIIENNSIADPDRLTVGQKLLIMTPTRTYTVRGTDTLARIADRFGIDVRTIKAHNPSLAGGDRLYPGQILSIKQDAPRYGMASANGYLGRGTDRERLATALPYLSYLTIPAGAWDGERIRERDDNGTLIKYARDSKIIPMMRVYDDTGYAMDEKYANALLKSAKDGGYGGITLASYGAMRKDAKGFSEFLHRLCRMTMDSDLLLFVEIDGNSELLEIGDVCNGYVMMYERAPMTDIKNAGVAEWELLHRAAELFEPSKTSIEIPSCAYVGGSAVPVEKMPALAYRGGHEIEYDDSMGICRFTHNSYTGGKKEVSEVVWESPEGIKAKLDTVGELGLMGMHFDIGSMPSEYLLMWNAMFRRPYGM